jgi:hypothetical protein
MTSAGPFVRLSRLNPERRRLLLRATFLLAVASTGISVLPFRRAIRFGCVNVSDGSASIDDVVWAVEAAARRVPWRAMCIEKGLVAQRMLRSSGIDAVLHYGARHNQDGGKLEAHVWVTVGRQAVIGGAEAAGFAAVARYP